MPQTTETVDITLLRTNKDEFILRCQRIIQIVVKHFVKSGMFTAGEFHDVIQSVNEELIKRLPKIEKNFDSRVLMVTYINVIVRNICLRIHEREHSDVETVPFANAELQYDEGNATALIVQDEIDRLAMILKLYGSQEHKALLCLKIYFRMPVTKKEIQMCFNLLTQSEMNLLLDRFGESYDDSLEIENFNILSPFMNRQEQNTTSGSSLRRWTLEHLTRITALLNGNPPNRSHTKETIKFLLEHYSS